MLRFVSNAFVNYLNNSLGFAGRSFKRAKLVVTREDNNILNAAFVLMLIVLVTKFTGLIFNSLSIGFVGADAYNEFVFASNIPEVISASILLGAISAAVIPTLVRAKEEGGKGSFLLVLNTLINVSLIFFAIVAILIAIFAGDFMNWLLDHILKPEEPPTVEQFDRIVLMLRVLLIPQVILGISTYISSSLNVYQRFIVPQLAPLFYNFGRIFALLVLVPLYGRNPWVLVWGTIVGALFHLVVQIPLARILEIRYIPVINIANKYIRNVANIALPRVLGLSAEQFAIGIDRIIAFGLIGNSLAAYELAVRLVAIPMALFGMTFSTASFPLITKAYIQGEKELFKDTFLKVMNQILFLSFPITIVLIVLRLPITRLFYGMFGNSLTWDETRMVAWVVMFFAIGLTFEALRSLVFKTYYAVNNSIIPLISAVFVVAGGIVTGIAFTNYFSHFDELSLFNLKFDSNYFVTRESGKAGVGGLALSASLVYSTEFFALILVLNYRYLKIRFGELVGPIFKKLFVSTLTAILAYMLYTLYNDILDTSKTWQIFMLTTSTVLAALLFYLWMSFLLKVKEVMLIRKLYEKLVLRYARRLK